MEPFDLVRDTDYWRGRFQAMASPCEVLLDTDDDEQAHTLASLAQQEARRIEHKFSRYRSGGIVHAINNAGGNPVTVDDETADLLDYAARCFELSEGRFDITSGILRRAWTFDGSDRVPDPATVQALLVHMGWRRVDWHRPVITLPAGMEIDLGGIGKEYAVDRVARQLCAPAPVSLVVNFGGDLYVSGPRRDGQPWHVGIDQPEATAKPAAGTVSLSRGGIATSGDTRRFLLRDGVRYGHILDPHTGWPVRGAPRTVTVIAETCTAAGILATLAMLHGTAARAFLDAQGVRYWCVE